MRRDRQAATYTLPAGTLAGDYTITAAYSDVVGGGYASSSGDATLSVLRPVDFTVVKTFADTSVEAGSTGHKFSIAVTNIGGVSANTVVITDTVDDRLPVAGVSADVAADCTASLGQLVSCTVASLAPGGSAYLTVTYGVVADPTPRGTVTNTANASADELPTPVVSAPASVSVGKATATCTVTPYDAPFDGTEHTASGGECTGVGGVVLTGGTYVLTGTAHTNAGSYPSDSWSWSNAEYEASGTVADNIKKINPDCSSIKGYSVTFNGTEHIAGGTCDDINGAPLAGLDLSGTARTNAGDWLADPWTFTSSDSNYNSTSGTVHDTIAKINPDCSLIKGYSVTFNGLPHTATGTCNDLKGEPLPGLDLSGTTHTNAGTYAGDAWSFTSSDSNYADQNGTVADAIGQAAATCTVTPYSVTFTDLPHTAGGSCVGLDGLTVIPGLDLSLTTHTNAGTYAGDTWSFHDASGNYADQNGTVADAIGQAAAVCSVTPYSVTFTGLAHTAGGSCVGLDGLTVIPGLDLSLTTHTNAGDYPLDHWTFHDVAGNYADLNGTVADAIGQAAAVCSVTGYSDTFNGLAHTASGSCVGLDGLTVIPGLDLSGTTHTNAGTYGTDPWTFHDVAGNYADQNGTVADTIGQAAAVCSVTGYSVMYDGLPHTAIGSCKDLAGNDLAGLDLSGTTHTDVGIYDGDPWTFTSTDPNYSSASGTVDDTIAADQPGLGLIKLSPTHDFVKAGDTIEYTYDLTNTGNVPLSGPFSVEDSLIVGGVRMTVTCPQPGTLAPDHSIQCTAEYSVTAADDAQGFVENTALAYAFRNDVKVQSNPDAVTVAAYHDPSLRLVKSASQATFSFVGEAIHYTYTVSNIGNVTLYGNVTHDGPFVVTDPDVDGGTVICPPDLSLAPGADLSTVCTATHTVTATDVTTGWVTNQATTEGHFYDVTVISSDSAWVPLAQLQVVKAFAEPTVEPGSTAHTFSIWVTNSGTSYLNGIVVTDTVDDRLPVTGKSVTVSEGVLYDCTASHDQLVSCTIDSLAPDDVATITVTYDVLTNPSPRGTVSNTASAVAAEVPAAVTAYGSVQIPLAAAVCKVTPYSVIYDGLPHIATGTCTGIGGVDLSADLDLSGTTNTDAGDYPDDAWSFLDPSGVYAEQVGTVHDVISQADPTCAVTPYDVTYDGASHTATGACTDVKGEARSRARPATSTPTPPPAATPTRWTFTDSDRQLHRRDRHGHRRDRPGHRDLRGDPLQRHLRRQ